MSNPNDQNMDQGSKYTRAVVIKTGYLIVIDQTLSNQLNLKSKTFTKNALNYLTNKSINTNGQFVLLYKAIVKVNKEIREHGVLLKFDEDTESAILKFLQSDEHNFPLCKHMKQESAKNVPTLGAKRAGICDRGECRAIGVGDLLTEYLNFVGGSLEIQNSRWKKFLEKFKPMGEFVVLDSSAPLDFVRNSAKYLTEPRKMKLTSIGDSNGKKIDAFTLREYKKSFGEGIKNGLRPLMLQGARKAANRDFIEQTIGHTDMDVLIEWRNAINDLLVAQNYNENLFQTNEKRLKSLKAIKSEGSVPRNLSRLKEFETVGPFLKRENPVAAAGLDIESVTGSFKTSLSLDEAKRALFPVENNAGGKFMLEANFLGSYGVQASREDVKFQEYVVPPMVYADPSSKYGPEKQVSYLRATSALNYEPAGQSSGFWGSVMNLITGTSAEEKSYSRRFDIQKSFFSKGDEVNVVYKGTSALGGFRETPETKLPGGSSASFKEITLHLKQTKKVLCEAAKEYEEMLINTPAKVETKSITQLLESGWFKGTQDESRLQLLSYVENIVSSDIYQYWFALSLRQLCFQLVDAVVASLSGVTKMSIAKPGLELFYDLVSIKYYEDPVQQLAMNDMHNYACAGYLKAVDALFCLNKTDVFGLEILDYALGIATRILQPNHVTNKTFIPSAGSSMVRYFEAAVNAAKHEAEVAINLPKGVSSALEKVERNLEEALKRKSALDLLFQTRSFLDAVEQIQNLQLQVDEYEQTKEEISQEKAAKARKANRRREVTLERFPSYFVLYNEKTIRVKYDVLEKRFMNQSEGGVVDVDVVRQGIDQEGWNRLVPINTLEYEGAEDLKKEYIAAGYHGETWFQVHQPRDFLALEAIRVNAAKAKKEKAELEDDIDEVLPEELVEKNYFELFEVWCKTFESSFSGLSGEHADLNQIYNRKVSKASRKEIVAKSRRTMPALLEQVNKNLYEITEFFKQLPGETVEVKYFISAHAEALMPGSYFTDFDMSHEVGLHWYKSIVSGLKKGLNESREHMSTKIGESSTVASIYEKTQKLVQGRDMVCFKDLTLSKGASDEFVESESSSYLNAVESKKTIEILSGKSMRGVEPQRIHPFSA